MKTYSVSQLTRDIKSVLEQSFPRLWVEGEISNYKRHSSGHIYFTLKDESAQISCAMWKFRAAQLAFLPQDGIKVLVEGDVQVYERSGNYQLIIQQIQPAGVGALQMAFEQLKRRLLAEGLFDDAHKKTLPPFPGSVGVITSPTGAAIRDIVSVIQRRSPATKIVLLPVRVQGAGAAEEIAAAIGTFNKYQNVDVLIVGRGGGSLEDLWAFNEEIVARAIFDSTVPVISAVGHEVDFSIADFVADHRAPTPSAAAEIAVRDWREIQGQLNYFHEKMGSLLHKRLDNLRDQLTNWQNSYAFRRPLDLVFQQRQRLDELQRSLTNNVNHAIQMRQVNLKHIQTQLNSLNPDAILKRGYSIATRNGKILTDASQLANGDSVHIRLASGGFDSTVTSVEPSDAQENTP
ncbi:MAG: exodeoxyribonuclease VII large subunit [Calditrichaeota bacterium]|nr:exodeoxyribonuclease VII large subunit [Calditrichota bacterium]MCB0266915.1 exodeoxyribonuclease VII large subunit [Calditrichota bacterium]MCB0301534.1 exodeoxyribonuclease VII large subunit [Calditrichota bacterium]